MSAAGTPVVYEVTLRVQAGIADEFRLWLDAHIAQMLALPGFASARLMQQMQPEDAGNVVFCCHYLLRDEAALDDYLREHAARMRADGQARFGGQFSAGRRVLALQADFPG